MTNSPAPLPADLLAATEALAEQLLETEPFMLYERAQARLQTDRAANKLLERFAVAQADLRAHQSQGQQVSMAEVEALRALQQAVQADASVQEYSAAQQAAAECLRQVNQDISDVLGVDFGALTKRGCC
jgi:cell fate (sporulation/competence/biofilm development) regulator YlbF (YheA/YmcA/DUF963 family)